ncbi:MAG: antibiotic biosynthesis monooxygenase [Proteobacteria bacterium]|nr:antibiotic biosynthesis monooxygenase [Pseudomonadota bacterium]
MRAAALVLSLLATIALTTGAGGPALSQEIFLVQYIDVTPAGKDKAAAALREARALVTKDDGNQLFEIYAESARPTRFAVVSLWRNQKAVDAYGASPTFRVLRDQLELVRVTPFDERWLTLLAGDPAGGGVGGRAASSPGAIHIVTHMDSIPPFKDEAADALKRLAEASVRQPGVVRYQVLVQTNRPNHFKLIETWADQKAFDAHAASGPAKQFRDFVQKGTGSPYDERLYKLVN